MQIFSEFFFFHLINLDTILNIFKKRMTLIAAVFLNLRTRKDVVRETFKKSYFREPLGKSHSKRAETPLKSERQHLYQIY